MLSTTSQRLTYFLAGLYAVLGAALFILPEQLAPVFAWKVSPFMTMTMGGWCLGNAWLAFLAARRWRWELVYTPLLYLALFGVLETVIVLAFSDKLQLGHPIAWLYLLTLLVNVVAVIVGLIEWRRVRPALPLGTAPLSRVLRGFAVVFVVIVAFLGAYGLLARIGDPGTNAQIFPEVMSLFTLKSFGAFYLSLALSVIPLFWARDRRSVLSHGFLNYGFLIFITLAGLVYLRLFNFSAHPFQVLYLGAYFSVAAVTTVFLLRGGTGTRTS
jgi:hypothetical protein